MQEAHMDTFFNYGLAQRTRELVEKMDDDTAQMFVLFTAYELHRADYDNNRRLISKRVREINEGLREEISKSLITRDSEEALQAARLVTEISKDESAFYDRYGRNQPRGPGGRYSRWSSTTRRSAGPTARFYMTPGPHGAVPAGNFDVTGALAEGAGASSRFAEKWHEANDLDKSTNARTYRRIAAGGELLGQVPNAKAQAAGQLGEFVGSFGPEAEKVVGPAMRRTAYRYRGTERTPDAKIQSLQERHARKVAQDEGIDPLRADQMRRFTPEMNVLASRNAAANYLAERLPSKQLAELQRQSGRIPPSEGLIINEDGDIITQAVGHADDHYLPFNLKNLKGLQGGHYVRSRSSGGLTAEDIYTGLVGGARSVTVVSRSGVFTVEFDDTLRGGRRYGDKAGSMVNRYEKTLDAVRSEKVAVGGKGLTPDQKAEIRDEVESEYGWADRATIEAQIKDRTKELKASNLPTKSELAEIDDRLKDIDDPRAKRRARSELIDNLMDSKAAAKYRLDGEGYKAAMEAMREQYPYYIAGVSAIVNRDPEDPRLRSREIDQGYVKPNYIRPVAAQEGYFDPSISGATDKEKTTGKFSAEEAHYANWAYNPQNKGRKAAEETPEEVTTDKGTLKPTGGKSAEVRSAVARAQAQKLKNETVTSIVNLIGKNATKVEDGKQQWPEIMAASTALERDGTLNLSQPKMDKLLAEVREFHPLLAGSGTDNPAHAEKARQLETMLTQYDLADSLLSGINFNREERKAAPAVSPRAPHTFEDIKGGLPASVYDKQAEPLFKTTLTEQNLGWDSSDTQLRNASIAQGRLYQALTGTDQKEAMDAIAESKLPKERMEQMMSLVMLPEGGKEPGAGGPTAAMTKKRLAEKALSDAENIERFRRLKAVRAQALENQGEPPSVVAGNVVQGTVVDRGLGSETMGEANQRRLEPRITTPAEHAETLEPKEMEHIKLLAGIARKRGGPAAEEEARDLDDLVVELESSSYDEDASEELLDKFRHRAAGGSTWEKQNYGRIVRAAERMFSAQKERYSEQ